MRIVCPSCQSAYEVPEALLAGGKAVRCARCGTEWAPLPPAPSQPQPQPQATPAPAPPPLVAEPPAEPEPPPRLEPRLGSYRPRSVDTVDDARPPPRDDEIGPAPRPRGAILAWLVTLLVLVALLWAAFVYRDQVMHAWPPSARLYALLGLR